MSGYIFLDKLKKMTDYLEEDYAKTLQIKKEIFRITQIKNLPLIQMLNLKTILFVINLANMWNLLKLCK